MTLLPTLCGCALLILLASPPKGGFIVLLFVPVLAVWLPYSIHVMWRHPDRRLMQATKVLLWLASVGGVCGLHVHYAIAARTAADRVVAAVHSYKDAHGTYPTALTDAGVVLADGGGQWQIRYAPGEGGTPALVYATTFTVFESYVYDFSNSRWTYFPD